VVVADINAANVKKVSEEIKALGRKSEALTVDVSQEKEVYAMVDKAVADFGKIDILVAGAGIADIKLSIDMTAAEWDKIFAVNVRGVFLCDVAVAKHMITRKQGKIINCASIAAHSGFSMLSAYSASKFAVRGFTQALAKELGQYNIQVNAYCPGIVGTDMWDLIDAKIGPILGKKPGETLKEYTKLIVLHSGTPGTPAQVANYVSYLASSDSDYMTGQSVMIDGGIVMS
jgi:meso-butanediol dehydrogenase/(S,S)-butanediol dehydrogenase/diacetyl reductase